MIRYDTLRCGTCLAKGTGSLPVKPEGSLRSQGFMPRFTTSDKRGEVTRIISDVTRGSARMFDGRCHGNPNNRPSPLGDQTGGPDRLLWWTRSSPQGDQTVSSGGPDRLLRGNKLSPQGDQTVSSGGPDRGTRPSPLEDQTGGPCGVRPPEGRQRAK
ncbi:unnamed protein product [Merluccius merluccius]